MYYIHFYDDGYEVVRTSDNYSMGIVKTEAEVRSQYNDLVGERSQFDILAENLEHKVAELNMVLKTFYAFTPDDERQFDIECEMVINQDGRKTVEVVINQTSIIS